MRVIAVANQKGGCGKTTTSINLAACLAFLGKKILLVDLDPQGHSTCGLGIQAGKLRHTLYNLLSPCEKFKVPFPETIQEINPNFFILPSYGILGAVEEELANLPDRDRRLKTCLAEIDQEQSSFDYAILDCPPNLGILTFNALEAADEVLIPVEPSFFSLHGLAKISETIRRTSHRRGRATGIHALLTLFDSRMSFGKEVYEEVKAHFKERLFKTIIHSRVALKEAAGAGKSIVDYDPESPAFQDYLNLAVEYLDREWDRLLPENKLGWENILHRRYGPKRVMGGILFQALSEEARSVEVAGDFNQWVPESLLRRDTPGLWQKVIPITSGRWRYKFIVDGEWQLDPYHPEQRQNVYGTYDSYLDLA